MTTQRVVNRTQVADKTTPAFQSILVDQKWKKPILIQPHKPSSEKQEIREQYEYYFTSQNGENVQVTYESWLAHETGDTYFLNPLPKKNQPDVVPNLVASIIMLTIMLTIAVLLFSFFIY